MGSGRWRFTELFVEFPVDFLPHTIYPLVLEMPVLNLVLCLADCLSACSLLYALLVCLCPLVLLWSSWSRSCLLVWVSMFQGSSRILSPLKHPAHMQQLSSLALSTPHYTTQLTYLLLAAYCIFPLNPCCRRLRVFLLPRAFTPPYRCIFLLGVYRKNPIV